MIRAGSTRKWMCGHQTRTRGTKWIRRCQSLKSILPLEVQRTGSPLKETKQKAAKAPLSLPLLIAAVCEAITVPLTA